MAETKKQQPSTKNPVEKTGQSTPESVDLGAPIDPFERVQKRKIAIAPGSTAEEKKDQITAVVKK